MLSMVPNALLLCLLTFLVFKKSGANVNVWWTPHETSLSQRQEHEFSYVAILWLGSSNTTEHGPATSVTENWESAMTQHCSECFDSH